MNATGHDVTTVQLNNLGQPTLRHGPKSFHTDFGVFDDIFPLWAAVQHHCRSHATIELLLENNADINQKTATGETALHHACRAMDFSMCMSEDVFNSICGRVLTPHIVEKLIERGSDVNCQDSFGMTPLHHACRTLNRNVALILLKNGADITIQDNQNRTPLEYAALEQFKTALFLLQKWNKIPRQARIEAYEIMALNYDCPDSYQYLLKAMRLRSKYRIRKIADPPLECYDNIMECETLTELRQCQHNPDIIAINGILARERILKGKFFDIYKDIAQGGMTCFYNFFSHRV